MQSALLSALAHILCNVTVLRVCYVLVLIFDTSGMDSRDVPHKCIHVKVQVSCVDGCVGGSSKPLNLKP